MNNLYDAHAHMQDPRLLPHTEIILSHAHSAGVLRIASCGTCPDDWGPLADLARRYPAIHPSFGLHPWYVLKQPSDWIETLSQYLHEFPQSGVGEIGLDTALRNIPVEQQITAFRKQWSLAQVMERPVSIHCRKAWPLLPRLLKECGAAPRGFLIHSFSGGREMVPLIQKLGGWFSFSGSITRPDNKRGVESLRMIPLDRLLLETDSPDMFPSDSTLTPLEPGLNEPAFLSSIVQRVAELLAMPPDKLGELTANNARLFFEGAKAP